MVYNKLEGIGGDEFKMLAIVLTGIWRITFNYPSELGYLGWLFHWPWLTPSLISENWKIQVEIIPDYGFCLLTPHLLSRRVVVVSDRSSPDYQL